MSDAPIIRLEQVNRIFQVGDQQVHALAEITLDIARGDYVSLMGPSGSGKSTLLHIIGLLDRPSSGRYLLEGKETTHYSDNEQARLRREHIGFVFQFFHLVPRLTAAENIELPLLLAGIPPEERTSRVSRVLQAFDIADRAHHRPEQLSGGQRQRVAIGRAMVSEPKVLLADEPTGNLDRTSGHEVIALLEEVNARGITLIVVTHDPELGQRAHRQLHMVDGRIMDDRSSPP
ncbi:MAG TPA: ABC transporter ATP-binding protein [Gammaproteobacteria bacterium]